MSTIINTRSPYYIKIQTTPPTVIGSTTASLRVWNDDLTADRPVEPQYVITKKPIVSGYTIYEISELVRDFITAEYYTVVDGQFNPDAVWVEMSVQIYNTAGDLVDTQVTTYLGLNGFGYFLEGAQPRQSIDPTQPSFTPMVLQSNTEVCFVRGFDIKIPIFSETQPTITTTIGSGVWNEVQTFWENADVNWDQTTTPQQITDSNNTVDKIQYLIIQSDYVTDGDTITITSTVGSPQTITIKLCDICEIKFKPIRSIFYNKFGALQDVWMNKKSIINMSVKDQNFKANVMNFGQTPPIYNRLKHSERRFNVVANETITLNTGNTTEQYNEPMKQLLMTEQSWLEDENEINPVVINTKKFTEKTSVNDRIIQYTIEFRFAFDKIQNIR
jgi:hypothetical protein